jgi:hypothetical protein
MTWTSPSENKTGPLAGMLESTWRRLILGSKHYTQDRMESYGHWFSGWSGYVCAAGHPALSRRGAEPQRSCVKGNFGAAVIAAWPDAKPTS